LKLKYLKAKHDGESVQVPYVEIKGKKPGKTLCLMSGVHGSEVTGVVSLWTFLEHAKKVELHKHLRGTLIVLPALNLPGIRDLERYMNGVDLNRAYMDIEQGSLETNLLAVLEKKILSKADAVLDFHDSGKRYLLMPHVRADLSFEKALDLVEAYSSEFVYNRSSKDYMLSGYMQKKYKTPVLTIESGGNFRLLDDNLRFCFDGIFSTLRSMKMYPGKNGSFEYKVFKERLAIKAEHDGLVRYFVEPGQYVSKGARILEMIDLATMESTMLYADIDAYVLGLIDSNAIKAGQKLVHLVSCNKLSRKQTKDFRAEIGDKFQLVKISM